MAYCPECGAEFGRGIRRCPECRVDLVEELSDPILEEAQDINLVVVREGLSFQEASQLKTLLERNGILCVVEPGWNAKAVSPAKSMQVLVNLKDEARCRQLILV